MSLFISVDWNNRQLVIRDPPDAIKSRMRLFFIAHLPRSVTVKGMNMSLTLNVLQGVNLEITPVDALGNPAPLDGVPVWEASNLDIISLMPTPDGLSAVALASGSPGTTQIRVTADARLGDEVVPLIALLDLAIVPAEAVSLGLTAGVPFEQTP